MEGSNRRRLDMDSLLAFVRQTSPPCGQGFFEGNRNVTGPFVRGKKMGSLEDLGDFEIEVCYVGCVRVSRFGLGLMGMLSFSFISLVV